MLNDKGFYRPTYDEIVKSKEQKAKELFGDDIDTGELTPLGKFIRINAYDLSKAYEDLELTYYARFPNTATGTSLDRLCVFAGITRNPPTQAQHKIRVYGEQNYSFGMGELIVCGEDADITFYSINENTINQSETVNNETLYYCDAIVECAEAGTVGNVVITDIVNPITEISNIKYIGVEMAGEDKETDLNLRKRFSVAIEGAGSNNANALRAALLRVENVTSADIIENEENEADTAGRPAHSFECYVSDGNYDTQKVAEAIFDKKPIGIKSCSTATGSNKITKTVTDAGGNEHTIYFSKVAQINIRLAIKFKKDASFNDNTDDTNNSLQQIKTNLCTYINGLGVGTDVILSKLYEHIYDVTGVTEVTELKISTDGTTYTTSNVTVERWQIAHLSADNITLTEVES